jgi:RimJ/RimL family protein N-acetyltransferase
LRRFKFFEHVGGGLKYAISADAASRSRLLFFGCHTMRNLRTERLLLRAWRAADHEPFARLNADPRVMEFFPAPLSRAESDALADRIEAHFAKHGFGLYAAELAADGAFIGFIGLSVASFEAHFTPCVEIGWRLAAEYWGRGLATEGAWEAVRYSFGELDLDSLVSMTAPANQPSRRVMEKLGMTHDPADDFDHPNLPAGHPLRRHVLYRLRRTRAATPAVE